MDGIEFKQAYTFAKLAQDLTQLNINYSLHIATEFEIISIADGRNPVNHSLCFAENAELISQNIAAIYILPAKVPAVTCVVVADPRAVFIKLLAVFQQQQTTYALLPVHRNLGIDTSAKIHANAIIEANVVIGEHTQIAAGCVLKSGTVIGNNSIVRENTVIGCDGIALYRTQDNQEVLRFPHLSGVIIGDNVEIGAQVVIVRGTLKPTIIADNVVIGNLCNIGHGVVIQEKVWLSVGVLIGGNCTLAAQSTLGLGANVKDNLTLATNSSIGMGTVITKNTTANSSYFGNPAKPVRTLNTGPKR